MSYNYGKNINVTLYGQSHADAVGIVLEGSLQVVREDYYGNRSLLTTLHPGELFAEAFACAGVEQIPVSVVAAEESCVLMVECRRVLGVCSKACGFHSRLNGGKGLSVYAGNIAFCSESHGHNRQNHCKHKGQYDQSFFH